LTTESFTSSPGPKMTQTKNKKNDTLLYTHEFQKRTVQLPNSNQQSKYPKTLQSIQCYLINKIFIPLTNCNNNHDQFVVTVKATCALLSKCFSPRYEKQLVYWMLPPPYSLPSDFLRFSGPRRKEMTTPTKATTTPPNMAV
jgi:hypothetical protein